MYLFKGMGIPIAPRAAPLVVSWRSSVTSSRVIIAGRFAAQCAARVEGDGGAVGRARLLLSGRWRSLGGGRPLVSARSTAVQRALPRRRSGRFIRSGNYSAVITRPRLIYVAVRTGQGAAPARGSTPQRVHRPFLLFFPRLTSYFAGVLFYARSVDATASFLILLAE